MCLIQMNRKDMTIKEITQLLSQHYPQVIVRDAQLSINRLSQDHINSNHYYSSLARINLSKTGVQDGARLLDLGFIMGDMLSFCLGEKIQKEPVMSRLGDKRTQDTRRDKRQKLDSTKLDSKENGRPFGWNSSDKMGIVKSYERELDLFQGNGMRSDMINASL